MEKLDLLFAVVLLAIATVANAEKNHKIVAYWGQNAVYNKHKGREYWEKDLSDFCRNYNYDVINIAFLNVFFSKANKDELPGLNFAYHCGQPVTPEYPTLLKCPKIERGIKECQKHGKKVLISLGGAVGDYGFKDDLEAVVFAYRVYHLFLAGKDKLLNPLRPFGSSIVDGVDLNIEAMDSTNNRYYSTFVKELRRLEKEEGSSKMMITAAPQCPFPDRYLGPADNKLLGDVPELIDEIYIQFYNNWCQTGNKQAFEMRFRQWMGFSINFNGPMVYIGLPADERASGNAKHYRTNEEVKSLYTKVKDAPKFGGVMLWDASFDQNSKQDGMRYSKYIGKLMKNSVGTTMRPEMTSPSMTTPSMTTPSMTTVKSSISCNGNRFGYFSHPTSCNKFIQCSHFKAYVKDCPSGLHFNSKINVCDWPRNVGCKI